MGRRRVHALLLAAVAAVAVLAGAVAGALGPVERWELDTVDARFSVRGERAPDPRIVVVGINDDSLSLLGEPWPLPRSLHARAIDRLTAAGARVIAYDVSFAEPGDEAEDVALQDALLRSRRVVLAATQYTPDLGPNVLFDDALLEEADASVGSVNFTVDAGGTIRRVDSDVEGLAAFSRVVAERFTGTPVGGDGFRDGRAWIDMAGPAGTYREIPFVDLVRGRVPAADLRDRIVVIGATASRLQDQHPVAFGDAEMSGAEVNAHAIATLLAGVPLRYAPGWASLLALVVPPVLVAASGVRRNGWLVAVAGVVVGAVYLGVAQLAFGGGWILPVVGPLVATAVATVGGVAVNAVTVDRERRRLRAQFARFVPPAVVDRVTELAGDDHRLPGMRVYGTVLFCDLRGFTAAAERLSPERVMELLDVYLVAMSDAVLDAGGTVVAYLGDGVMAVFGAPVEAPDHADRALAAARAMRDVHLPEFNRRMAGTGLDPFAMGIGICSGPLMAGTVGSDRRMEYTVVGDTVNTASRLQALTKDAGHAVLVADTTRAALVGDAPDLVAVGALDVRGHQVPAGVWTLRDPSGGDGGEVAPPPV